MTETRKCIATRMRLGRENAGLSQTQVAKLLGVHRPTISQIETGQRRVSADELKSFSGLYKVDVSWLACADADDDDEYRDRVALAAREMSSLKDSDLDAVMALLKSMRGAK